MKYQNIISLGFFCGPAQEIKSIGLRNASYPFDWIISNFESVLLLLKNNFKDFLKEEFLIIDKTEKELKETYVIKNTKYDIKFFHDFKKGYSIYEQLPEIKEKYNRRIQRLYKTIEKSTLFIRYIKDEEELFYIIHNLEDIKKFIKSFNLNNDIIFICNNDLNDKVSNQNIYWVEKDNNYSVNRHFLKSLKSLKKFIKKNVYYNKMERVKNIILYKKEQLNKKIKNMRSKNENKHKI